MGLTITADGAAPLPRAVTLTLTCDAPTGLFRPAVARFTGAWFPDLHHAAMAAGWRETFDARGRVFLCPDCSGKKAKA